MLLLVTVAFLLVLAVVFHVKMTRGQLYRAVMNQFEGPKVYPIIGNAHQFFGLADDELHSKVQEICDNYERFTRIWTGPWPHIILYDPKDVEVLLSGASVTGKSYVYTFLYDWLATGLLTSSGSKWRTRRKTITPTFHFKILEDFLPVFNGNGSILIDKLSTKVGEGTFNVYELINLYTLDNVCETALGVKIDAQQNAESKYVSAIKDMRLVITVRFFTFWLYNDLLFKLSKYGRIQSKALGILHESTETIIKKRRKELESYESPSSPRDFMTDEIGRKKKMAFLDLLILSGDLSDSDIREEVDTFMFEGHDTVSSALSFALYCLAHNQLVQENAYLEQNDVFGNSDRDPTIHDLQAMKYLEMVIKESLRLYPSVPFIGRNIEKDVFLSDGYFLPKGCQCIVNIAKLQRDPNVWPYPNEFNPKNFLPELSRTRNPYSFVPFSAGPRNCIGQRFAMIEMKSCISKILRKFKLNPSNDSKENARITSHIVLFSSNGVNIQIENRTKTAQ